VKSRSTAAAGSSETTSRHPNSVSLATISVPSHASICWMESRSNSRVSTSNGALLGQLQYPIGDDAVLDLAGTAVDRRRTGVPPLFPPMLVGSFIADQDLRVEQLFGCVEHVLLSGRQKYLVDAGLFADGFMSRQPLQRVRRPRAQRGKVQIGL